MQLSASEKNSDFYNNVLLRGDKGQSLTTYYHPSGRQLKRAAERAHKKYERKYKCKVPAGFLPLYSDWK